MNKEKMLYHAKHNGSLRFQSHEYRGNIADNLNFLIDGGFLTWETHNLWREYNSCGEQDLYENAFHEYKITPEGEVLLAVYRLEYADKNNKGTEKHISRINEFKLLLEQSNRKLEYYLPALTANQKKVTKSVLATSDTTVSNITIQEKPLGVHVHNMSLHPKYSIDKNDIDLSEMSLVSMFNMSTSLGPKGTDRSRSEDYVLRKINEELGEMTLEMNIADGLSYKQAGKDGVKGEAVDLAICALDMFALQCPGMSAEEIEREFLAYMIQKLNKWRDSLSW